MAALWAMPPGPGFNGPAPVFPPGVEVAGPNKLAGYGQCETVTILMDFPDNRADTVKRRAARFDSMLYSTNAYKGQPYRQGSLNDFYLENSYGTYTVRGGVAGNRWFRSTYNYSRYYDGNYMLSTGGTLARENIQQIDALIDFRQFDINNDGHIDAMFMVHAGADGADDGNVNHCWSHALPSFNYLTNDGVVIDGVTNVPEYAMVTPARETTMSCIAVMCHELGHLVGLPDLYDGSRYYYGPGYWGLMSYGAWGAGGNTPWSPSHMEAWSKIQAGFVTPTVITRDTLGLRILPVETNQRIYKVWRNGLNLDTCFYLENRQLIGFDSPLPGPGLLIWHIDPAMGSYYRRVDLEEDSTAHLDRGNGVRPDPHVYHQEMGDTSDPLPGNWNRTVFDSASKPSSRNRNNANTRVSVRNIRQVGDTIICDILLGMSTHDVGCARITAPTGTVDSGTTLTPACSVYNYGNVAENYAVRMRIGAAYSQTASVSAHSPGTRVYLTFPSWTAGQRGVLAVSCSTGLSGDQVPGNDRRQDSVLVRMRDVSCSRLLVPFGTLDSGTVVTPACTVANFGSASADYSVRMKIGAGYNATATVTGHATGTSRYLTFPVWTASPVGALAVSCSTELAGDLRPANDRQTGNVTVRQTQVHDVACLRIVAPAGLLDSGNTVAPGCSVANLGNQPESFSVRMRIGVTYDNTASVAGLAPGLRAFVTFPDWTARPRGNLAVVCSTELGGDNQPANDRQSGSVMVAVRDVGVVQAIAPVGQVMPGPVVPQVVVHNYGNVRDTAKLRIWFVPAPGLDGNPDSVVLSGGLPVGVDTAVSFPVWNATPEGYAAYCAALAKGDPVRRNDTLQWFFDVAGPVGGWVRGPDLPAGVKGKKVKDGGCLACSDGTYMTDTTYVYALKGNGTCEFYRFSTAANVWTTRESIPAIGSSGRKKAVKKGASITDAESGLFAAKGNGTTEWWKYDPALSETPSYPWTQKTDVPLGAKAVKEGSGSASVKVGETTCIYLLKGSGTTEFYRYNTITGTWLAMANAPAGASGKSFKDGSCIAASEDGTTIFALKGSYNEFFAYDVVANTWSSRQSLPLTGSAGRKKKVKSGAGIACLDGCVYALKGGGTDEFWQYQADSDRWLQGQDIPAGSGRPVKGGGALTRSAGTNSLYAFKGNNTLDFFKYGLAALDPLEASGTRPKAQSSPQSTNHNPQSDLGLRLSPSVLVCGSSPVIRIDYTLPKAGNATVKLYDITGQLVTTLASGYNNAGSYKSTTPLLASGIYVLKLTTDNTTFTAKLIVE
jgi:immune inhibitor A